MFQIINFLFCQDDSVFIRILKDLNNLGISYIISWSCIITIRRLLVIVCSNPNISWEIAEYYGKGSCFNQFVIMYQ